MAVSKLPKYLRVDGDGYFVGNIRAANFSGSLVGTNTGDITLATFGASPAAAGASLSGQVLTLQPADATHGGGVSTGTQSFAGNKTFTGTIAASNLSNSNSGDVTIGTANGLSLSGQALSLAVAVASGSGGALSGADKAKLDGLGGTSSGSNTGDVTLANFGSSPATAGASLSGQVLTLQPADTTHGGGVSTTTQSFAGAKTFTGAIAASNLSNTNSGDITLATVGSTPAAAGASLSAQVLTLQPADATHGGVVSTAAQTFAGTKTFSAAQLKIAPTTSGAIFSTTAAQTDAWMENISSSLTSLTHLFGGYWDNPGHNASFFDGAHGYVGTASNHPWQVRTNNIGRLTVFANGNVAIGSQSDGGHKLDVTGTANITSTLTASNLSGTNTGDITLGTVGSSPAAAGASLSGQILTLQPANASNGGVVSTTTQTLAGAKTFSSTVTSSIASGSDAFALSTGAFVNFGGRTLKDSGSGIQASSGMFQSGGIQNLSASIPCGVQSNVSDAAGRIGVAVQMQNTLSNATAKIITFENPANTIKAYWTTQGTPAHLFTDSTGTPGAATINKTAGRSAIAASATSVIVTNSEVTATDIIQITPEDIDTAIAKWKVAPALGSFTVTVDAAAAATWKFNWFVVRAF